MNFDRFSEHRSQDLDKTMPHVSREDSIEADADPVHSANLITHIAVKDLATQFREWKNQNAVRLTMGYVKYCDELDVSERAVTMDDFALYFWHEAKMRERMK